MPEESGAPRERPASRRGSNEGRSSVPRETAFGRMAEACGCGPPIQEMVRHCCGVTDQRPPEDEAG